MVSCALWLFESANKFNRFLTSLSIQTTGHSAKIIKANWRGKKVPHSAGEVAIAQWDILDGSIDKGPWLRGCSIFRRLDYRAQYLAFAWHIRVGTWPSFNALFLKLYAPEEIFWKMLGPDASEVEIPGFLRDNSCNTCKSWEFVIGDG